jgi:hypothetical protein
VSIAEAKISLVAVAATIGTQEREPMQKELNRSFAAGAADVGTVAERANLGRKQGISELHVPPFRAWDV